MPTWDAKWIPHDVSVQVAGRDIGGMIYLGAKQRHANAVIQPGLSVAEVVPPFVEQDIPAKPSYEVLTPKARAAYLNWLAEGRRDVKAPISWLFLYVSGLAHRFFIDHSKVSEQVLLMAEFQRLSRLYQRHGAAQELLLPLIYAAEELLMEPFESPHLLP